MKKFVILTIIFLSVNNIYGEFIPWQRDVLVGDEKGIFKVKRKRSGTEIKNGVQGGAYFLLRFFQVVISPQDGPNCRHVPVCSVYCKHALEKHGAMVGSLLAGDRLLRCNPFYPPERKDVPEKILK